MSKNILIVIIKEQNLFNSHPFGHPKLKLILTNKSTLLIFHSNQSELKKLDKIYIYIENYLYKTI